MCILCCKRVRVIWQYSGPETGCGGCVCSLVGKQSMLFEPGMGYALKDTLDCHHSLTRRLGGLRLAE